MCQFLLSAREITASKVSPNSRPLGTWGEDDFHHINTSKRKAAALLSATSSAWVHAPMRKNNQETRSVQRVKMVVPEAVGEVGVKSHSVRVLFIPQDPAKCFSLASSYSLLTPTQQGRCCYNPIMDEYP